MAQASTHLNSQDLSGVATVVNLVRTDEAVTRPEIGRVTGLGRSVVAHLVKQGIDIGLLADFEFGPSTGGRSPRRLRFVGERAGILVGVFGAMGVSIGVTDLVGNLLQVERGPWDIAAGPEPSMDKLDHDFRALLRANGNPQVWGVAVGVPGPVEFGTGRPLAPPIMPGWNGFDIRGALETRFSSPVWVDNDANMMARGRLGAVKDPQSTSLLFVKVGTGIGAGLISHGRVHRGARGGAGDVGHIKVTDCPNVICRCGQIGCLEAVAGGWALARDGLALARSGSNSFLKSRIRGNGVLLPEDVVEGAVRGDAACVKLVSTSGRVVGENVASMISFFNPAVVTIGGVVASAGDIFLTAARQSIYRRSLPLATRDLEILAAADPDEGVRGAAALVIDELFIPTTMQSWLTAGRPAVGSPGIYASLS